MRLVARRATQLIATWQPKSKGSQDMTTPASVTEGNGDWFEGYDEHPELQEFPRNDAKPPNQITVPRGAAALRKHWSEGMASDGLRT